MSIEMTKFPSLLNENQCLSGTLCWPFEFNNVDPFSFKAQIVITVNDAFKNVENIHEFVRVIIESARFFKMYSPL